MFCPKCGKQNPDDGKFCRSCGTALANVSDAISGRLSPAEVTDHRGRPVTWENVVRPIFLGTAFFVIAIVLGLTGAGRGWWYWMLIPAFTVLGSGVTRYILLKKSENTVRVRTAAPAPLQASEQNALPPQQTEFVPVPESRFKTGDLVPPSVTEGTTRHLKSDPEGETMTLPKI